MLLELSSTHQGYILFQEGLLQLLAPATGQKIHHRLRPAPCATVARNIECAQITLARLIKTYANSFRHYDSVHFRENARSLYNDPAGGECPAQSHLRGLRVVATLSDLRSA